MAVVHHKDQKLISLQGKLINVPFSVIINTIHHLIQKLTPGFTKQYNKLGKHGENRQM